MSFTKRYGDGFVGREASSSIGRVPVSKTGGWGFDALLACQEVLAIRCDSEDGVEVRELAKDPTETG